MRTDGRSMVTQGRAESAATGPSPECYCAGGATCLELGNASDSEAAGVEV